MSDPDALNVDLEVESATRPDALIRELEARGTVLSVREVRGLHAVSFELDEAHESISATLDRMIVLVDELPSAAADEWYRCTSRVFDVGVTAGFGPPQRWWSAQP